MANLLFTVSFHFLCEWTHKSQYFYFRKKKLWKLHLHQLRFYFSIYKYVYITEKNGWLAKHVFSMYKNLPHSAIHHYSVGQRTGLNPAPYIAQQWFLPLAYKLLVWWLYSLLWQQQHTGIEIYHFQCCSRYNNGQIFESAR